MSDQTTDDDEDDWDARDDWDDEGQDLQDTSVRHVVDLVRSHGTDSGRRMAALRALLARDPAEHGRVVLAALIDYEDQDSDFRVDLFENALHGPDDRLSSAAWWLMLHSDLGGLSGTAPRARAERLIADAASRGDSHGAGLTSVLANEDVPGRLRAIAGAELVGLLGWSALPLLTAHLGHHLVDWLEEAADDREADALLLRLARDPQVAYELRLSAAEAQSRLAPDLQEELFAELAIADGLSMEQRVDALEVAVESADSAAADAALAVLRLALPAEG